MFRRQFIVAGFASTVLTSAKLHGAARGQAANPAAQTPPTNASPPPDWVNPFPPHRVMGNIYYVGSEGLVISDHYVRRKHLDQQQPRSKRAFDSGEHRKTRLQIQRYKNSAHQPRPLGPLRR